MRRLSALTLLLVFALAGCRGAETGDGLLEVPRALFGYVGEAVRVRTAEPASPYTFDFGDGRTVTIRSGTYSLTWDVPGHYAAVAWRGALRIPVLVTIVNRPLDPAPTRSGTLAWSGDARSLWVVNTDQESVSLVDGPAGLVLGEVKLDFTPGALALAEPWLAVAGPDADQVAVIHVETRSIYRIAELEYGSRPVSVVAVPGRKRFYLALEQRNRILELNPETGLLTELASAEAPRALAAHPDGTVWASRFRSLDGEGRLLRIAGGLAAPVTLPVRGGADSDTETRGVPSQIGAVALTPAGDSLWIPAVQANLRRGLFRDGQPLTFETTVRAMISFLGADDAAENPERRKLFDDRDQAVAVAFTPAGDYAYVAVQGAGTVEVLDALDRTPAGSIFGVGIAPRDLGVSPDGGWLAVHGAMSRTVTLFDLAAGPVPVEPRHVIATSVREKLEPGVLAGKVLFHRSDDVRLSRSGYVACASCHAEGGDDGLVWDFTDRGEGLRNTIPLRGRAGTGHGPLHWTANFDEVQDFEHDIRGPFGGTGVLADEVFYGSGVSEPLGAPKAGLSADLDALAAYLASLTSFGRSPFRDAAGALTPSAERGRAIFLDPAAGCGDCHIPPRYTDSNLAEPVLHDVGTLRASSGARLGEALTGLDTPTLRGLFASAPYLHDGSAATLREVLTVRNADDRHGVTSHLRARELDDLEAFLLSLDDTP